MIAFSCHITNDLDCSLMIPVCIFNWFVDANIPVDSGTPEHGGSALLILSANMIFSHFHLTFILLSGLTSL